jgi:hypothetical protein
MSTDLKTEDPINHPAHYNRGKLQYIDAAEAMLTQEDFIGALKFNVGKYLWREKHKGNRLQDLKKAQWYLNKIIETLESNEGAK